MTDRGQSASTSLVDADRILSTYEAQEKERIRDLLPEAKRLWEHGKESSIREVLFHLFEFQDKRPDQSVHFGSPAHALELAGRTVVQLLPESRPGSTGYADLTMADLRDHIAAGRILPILREPRQYQQSPGVCAIIEEFGPPNHFWRNNLFYSLLCDGDEHFRFFRGRHPFSGLAYDWFAKAWEGDLVKAALTRPEVWEPGHRRQFRKLPWRLREEVIRESFSFKYVNAAALLGKDFVDELLHELKVIGVEKALEFLTWFHIITDHPISHAFLTNAVVLTSSREWHDFLATGSGFVVSRELVRELDEVPIRLFLQPTAALLDEAANAGLEPLPIGIITLLGDFTKEGLDNYTSRLRLAAYRHSEQVGKLERIGESARHVLRFAGAGVGLIDLCMGGHAAAAAVKGALSMVGADLMHQHIMKRLRKWSCDHLLTAMWKE